MVLAQANAELMATKRSALGLMKYNKHNIVIAMSSNHEKLVVKIIMGGGRAVLMISMLGSRRAMHWHAYVGQMHR